MFANLQQEAVRRDEEGAGINDHNPRVDFNLLPPEIRDRVDRVRNRLNRSIGRIPFDPILYDTMKPGVVVDAPRRCGKTEAILWMVDQYHGGNAIIIAMNDINICDMRYRYRTSNYRGEPKFIAPALLGFLDGHSMPVFCDEFFLHDERVQNEISRYSQSNRNVIAVGSSHSQHPDYPTFQCMPL